MSLDGLGEIVARLRDAAKGVPCGVALSPAMLSRLRRASAGSVSSSWVPGIPYVVDPRLDGTAEAFFDEALWRARCAEQRQWDVQQCGGEA